MLGEPHTYGLQVLEHHLDSFGHVNNATYLELLEEARWDWITARGYGLERVHELQQGPTILEIQIKFRREIRNRMRIRVVSQLQSYDRRIARMSQRILDQEGQLLADAVLVFGLFDMRARKLITPTAEWLQVFGVPRP